MKIVLLTSAELRHSFFRKGMALASGVEVLRTYCEGTEKSLRSTIDPLRPGADLQQRHLHLRDLSEQDFFGPFVDLVPDHSNPRFIERGGLNSQRTFEEIVALQPDLLVAYGCSLVRDPLLSAFAGRFLNVHLGLSPWYRGRGTNFWPLVNGEPEFVGLTFMHLDAGVDTGAIIHQVRARVYAGDSPHQIGNRLIGDMVSVYAALVRGFDRLEAPVRLPAPPGARLYKMKDFSPESTARLYANFEGGLVDRYLREQEQRCLAVPLHTNAALVRSP